jgi:hypothetical protein
MISEAPFGTTKVLVVDEVELEEEGEGVVLDDLVVEIEELAVDDDDAVLAMLVLEALVPVFDADECEGDEDVIVVEDVVACMPSKV